MRHKLPKHPKHSIIPLKLKIMQKKLRHQIDKALKHKLKPVLPNHDHVLLGRTQNTFDGENSEELLKDILNLETDDSETDQDYFKGALLTKSKVYNITKMPDNNLHKSYYVHKKENISVDLRHSNNNYSDTHIITLETIINPDKYTNTRDNSIGEPSVYVEDNYIPIEPSKRLDDPTEFVGSIFVVPNQLNIEPSPGTIIIPLDPQKVPKDFIGGSFVDLNEPEVNDDDRQSSSETETPEQPSTDSITTETQGQTSTDSITELSESNDPDEQTTSPPEKESESDDYFVNSMEMVDPDLILKKPNTESQLTEEPSETKQNNVVTDPPTVSSSSGSNTETGAQTTTTIGASDSNDGLDVESSNTHTSVAQYEPPTTILGNDEILQGTHDNTLDDTEEDLPSEHDVEIYAGNHPGTLTSNDLPDRFTDDASTTPSLTDYVDDTESSTSDPNDELLTELCFPLLNYKNVSLYNLLTGKFFLDYKGKTIPLKLGKEPMQNCHSGTKKCRLHLHFSNSEKNKMNKSLESKIEGEDKEPKHIEKRQIPDSSNFQPNKDNIVDYIYSTTENLKTSHIEPEKDFEGNLLNKILNFVGSKPKTQQTYKNWQDLNQKEHEVLTPTTEHKLIEMLKQHNTSSDDYHQAHIHDYTGEDIQQRHIRSIHSSKSETEEKSSCGCKDILGRTLPPIPPYEHFLGKRLDILTNIAHAMKDWYVTTS